MSYNIEDLLSLEDDEFSEDIDLKAEKDIDILPICHVTSYNSLSRIRLSGTLHTSKCPVYGEELLYFFYGKAKYIPKEDVKSILPENCRYPVALIVEGIHILRKMRRFVVFDSGYYKKKNDDTQFPINEFTVEKGNYKMIKRYVRILYKNNENYNKRNIRQNLVDAFPEYHSLRYIIDLHLQAKATTKTNNFDTRVFTIEIQYDDEVNLLRCAKKIVIPDRFATSTASRKRLARDLCLNGENNVVPYNTVTEGKESLIGSYVSLQETTESEIFT